MTVADPARLIDAYAHVGMPRFLSITDYRQVMADAAIGRSVLCAFDSCPDLAGIHSALLRWPRTFRALGVPIGPDRAQMQAALRAQLAAGFSGIRLTDADITQRPWLLETIAEHRRIAVVCGHPSAAATARILVAHLDKHAGAIVVGGHFAGADDPGLLQHGPAAELFSHPRFFVVFSRHGGYPSALVERWAAAVIARTGWDRVMWGSEAPVLFWRNETLRTALDWVDRLGPTASQRQAFFAGNAARLYFAEPARTAPLELPFDPWHHARPIPAGLWASGLPVEQSLVGRLVHGWLAGGGHGSLGDYAQQILDRGLPPLPR